MKSIVAALVLVLVFASSASAAWAYVAPGPMVYTEYYGPTAAAVAYPAPMVVARPVVAMPPVYYAPAPVVYGGYPYVLAPRVLVPGQPVRNVLRATFR